MELLDLELQIEVALKAMFVTYNKVKSNVSVQFTVGDFGVVVCGIDRSDYALVDESVGGIYSGWRTVYITTQDNMAEKRLDIIWSLMAGGYMSYIRTKYKRQFTNLIVMQDFGKQIIDERLKRWDDKPKYKWLIAENKAIRRESGSYIISVEPGFYDMMPEEGG